MIRKCVKHGAFCCVGIISCCSLVKLNQRPAPYNRGWQQAFRSDTTGRKNIHITFVVCCGDSSPASSNPTIVNLDLELKPHCIWWVGNKSWDSDLRFLVDILYLTFCKYHVQFLFKSRIFRANIFANESIFRCYMQKCHTICYLKAGILELIFAHKNIMESYF